MADKKINETILQQRKAREEFLKLKQMQNNNSAETVEKREEYKPRTFKEKLDNFWFHYKWHTIAILLALVVLCTGVSQCAGRTNYDMEIVYFAFKPIQDERVEKIAEYFEDITSDINGDGEVHVQIINCSITKSPTGSDYDMAIIQKLQTTLAGNPSALLFITDGEGMKYLDNMEVKDGIFDETVELRADFYESVDNKETPVLPENLQISLRRIKGTTIENKKETKNIYAESLKILEKMFDDSDK